MSGLTPMMEQYQAIKGQYPDCLLFFRLGDFYELFGEDARVASRELQIVLTSREIGKNQKTPMCGVPYHAAEGYLKKLLDCGHKVAICEQLEEPRPGKTLVKRDVVRVLTPGTILNPIFLEQEKNNYIISVTIRKDNLGCAWSDISTGEFTVAQFCGSSGEEYLLDLISRLEPVECLARRDQFTLFSPVLSQRLKERGVHLTQLSGSPNRAEALSLVEGEFGPQLTGIDRQELEEGLVAVGQLLNYILETQKAATLPSCNLKVYTPEESMYLDSMTRRNLELFTTAYEGKREGSLYWALNRTRTAMGSRLLRNWLEFPLLDLGAIRSRQDGVEEIVNNFRLRDEVGAALKEISDLERIIGRVEWQLATPRDLLALGHSLSVIPRLKEALDGAHAVYLKDLNQMLEPLPEIRELIKAALVDDPPLNIKDGGIIKTGYHPDVDRLRELLDQGSDWIKEFEAGERARTGIKSLKVSYNKVFGYYIEVSKANLQLVPADYQRRQTLVQGERFITPELKEREETITTAREQLVELEHQLFLEVRCRIGKVAEKIRCNARVLAILDCLHSFAESAIRYHYVKPEVNDSEIIRIVDGRHPVLEQMIPEGSFIPNDLHIGEEDNRIHLLTGPNMAGKSTFMRQMAILVLMAQCGSFIPAVKAEIGLVDRVFVRAGASDDLSRGVSTFMLEMQETSYILHHATGRSFIVLDEIGRGTGTFDGMGIAWALVEYLHNRVGARAIFATHYHQLTRLEEKLTGVVNYHIAVAEQGEEIVFLRKVVPGGTDRSYGIQVARLARLPEELVSRAGELAAELEKESGSAHLQPAGPAVQLSLFREEEPLLQELRELDLINTTPLKALNLLFEWQRRLQKQLPPRTAKKRVKRER